MEHEGPDSSQELPPPGGPGDNPYAPPGTAVSMTPLDGLAATGELRQRHITIEEVFGTSWSAFRDQLGSCVIAGIVLLGMTFGLWMIFFLASLTLGLAGGAGSVIALQIIEQVVFFFVGAWFGLAGASFATRLLRNGQGSVSDLFSVGHCYGRGLACHFLYTLATVGVLAVCCVPGLALGAGNESMTATIILVLGVLVGMPAVIALGLRYSLGMFFIVDRGLGPIEALSASGRYMGGNKLTVLLAGILAGLGATLAVLLSCGIGMLFAYPFLILLGAAIYFLATGQVNRYWREEEEVEAETLAAGEPV